MGHKFLEPITIGKQEVKNRVVYLAMAKCYSGMDGSVSPRDLAYIASIAKGGVGIVIPGAMVVDPAWPSVLPMQPVISEDKYIPGLTKLADTAHENGAKILFQLWHPGQVDYSRGNPPTINELSVDQIHEIQKKFVDAAVRAKKAGADGIEFQMCHNYLAAQFLSPLFNHRTDEYGLDTLENQVRFSVEMLKMLREAIGPEMILAVKLQGFDGVEGGITPEMAASFAPFIEQSGADMITVSAGGSLTGINVMSGDGTRAEGWKVEACNAVKKAVSIPVCATGNIRHPEYVDEIIEDGKCDMVGMGRGIFAEREWVNKCAEGREDELKYCISCMNCWNYGFIPDQSGCSVNPYAGRELSCKPLPKDGEGRMVVVVGAGPAGCEAALTLAERGFRTILFEKSGRIGGMVNIAKLPPHKDKMGWSVTYYENMLAKSDVDLRLNTEATAGDILKLNPYAVVIAAGSNETSLPVPGMDAENVLQARVVLEEEFQTSGKNIVVIGAGLTGIETAIYMKEQGNHVTVLDFAKRPSLENAGMGGEATMEMALELSRAEGEGIVVKHSHKVLEFADGMLKAETIPDGEKTEFPADYVVLSTGIKPADAIYNELKMAGHPLVHKIGDANFNGKIVTAVQAGNKYACNLF
ncbi:MAG: NAD(P)/FAD-dependent oxidoreductase [Eubacteriales bacterium]|nr:NAD(P)/FAD-dependent oxidoreductase [Eubacteriales bacterium]